MQTAVSTHTASVPAASLHFPGYARTKHAGDISSPAGATLRLAKNEELFGEGDRAAFFYKVVSGAVRTYKLLDDGRRQIDAFHFPGDIFGIESGEEHRFTAEAVAPARVVSFRRCSLETLVAGDGQFARPIIAAILRSLERAQDHMLLLGRKSALQKIAHFILDTSQRASDQDVIELPMSRGDIADHLGLTIESVSRSLTRLARQGVIELAAQRRTIVLRDKPALRRLDA
jgi:CRP/FNR family nitrogen fixation transcriptional regulator